MKQQTHLKIDEWLCGALLSLTEGNATVELKTTLEMAVDEKSLVHGGFIFGAADYAAMAAVNHPNVVLGAAETKFLKPTQVGETILLTASVVESKGKRHRVEVIGTDENAAQIFTGVFQCFVLETHVLDQ